MTCSECGADKVGTIQLHKHGCSRLGGTVLPPYDQDCEPDEGPDNDYGYFEDSPNNPNVPKR